jgi:hypothetical protein
LRNSASFALREPSLTSPLSLQYSTWGHVKTLADAEKRGIEKAGGTVDLFQ